MSYAARIVALTITISSTTFAAPTIDFTVIETRPHNPNAFTQGLLIDDDTFYESSGLYQRSFVTRYPVDAEATSNKPLVPSLKHTLPGNYFAEGLALHDDKLYLLTWMEKTLFVLSKDTLKPITTMAYEGQGWGLASDGTHLIRSDGTATLYFHKPNNFSVERQLLVTDNGQAIDQINELEYANGYLWANVWHKDVILQIDPTTGKVIGELDLSEIKSSLNLNDTEKVLNGIAWDDKREGFWITGKLWPTLYLIQINDDKP